MPTSHSLVPIDTQTTPILRLLPDYLIHCQSTHQYIRSPHCQVLMATQVTPILRLPLHTTLIMPIHRPLPFSNYSQTTLCIVNLLTNTPSPSHCQVLMATQATPILDQPSITLRLLPSSDYHRLLNPL